MRTLAVTLGAAMVLDGLANGLASEVDTAAADIGIGITNYDNAGGGYSAHVVIKVDGINICGVVDQACAAKGHDGEKDKAG